MDMARVGQLQPEASTSGRHPALGELAPSVHGGFMAHLIRGWSSGCRRTVPGRHSRWSRIASSAEQSQLQREVPAARKARPRVPPKVEQQDAVKFARMASPYIEGHRGRTFVVQIPGDLIAKRARLVALLNDIVLLHGAQGRETIPGAC